MEKCHLRFRGERTRSGQNSEQSHALHEMAKHVPEQVHVHGTLLVSHNSLPLSQRGSQAVHSGLVVASCSHLHHCDGKKPGDREVVVTPRPTSRKAPETSSNSQTLERFSCHLNRVHSRNRLVEEYGNVFREDLKESAVPSLGYWNATHGLQASVCCGNLAEPTSKWPVMDFCRRFQANLL